MELLARQFVHLPTRVRRGVVDEAQGNPLALLEFAALAGGSHDGGRPHTIVTSGMSREVRTLYEARIERLPEPTRRLLLLAVLDGSGGLGVLAAASGSGGLDELGPAERDHLIVVDDRTGAMRFRHPMIKSVVVERSTHEERRAAHLRLAVVFADQPERRGHHLGEAALAPDEDVAAAVEDGAHRTLRRGDVVGAISRLTRAADLSPDPKDRSRRLADAAYVGVASAGQIDSASELLRDAHRRDPTAGETLHAAAATAYLLLNSEGNAQTTHRLLTVAIESALGEPDHDRDGLSEALYTLVLVCHYAGREEYWVPLHDAMGRLGASAPADVRLLAETFADPVTASGPGAVRAGPPSRRAEEHRRQRPHHSDRDRRVLRRPASGLPRGAASRRPERTGGWRRRRGDDGDVDARLRRARRRPVERSAPPCRRGHADVRGAWISAVRVERLATPWRSITGNRGDRDDVPRPLRGDDRVGGPAAVATPRRLGAPRTRRGRPQRRRLRGVLRTCHRHQPAGDARGPTTRRRCGPRWT